MLQFNVFALYSTLWLCKQAGINNKCNKNYKELILTSHIHFVLRFILFACVHSLLATNKAKELISRLTVWNVRPYRLCYNMLSLVMFGWVMAADRHSAVLYYVPGAWSLFMYLIQALAAAMIVLCLRQTGVRDFIGFSQLQKDSPPSQHLVTSGFYAMVRHPLYLLSMIFLVMNPVMTEQWLLLTLLSCIYFTVGAMIEEKRMIQGLGEEYRRYRQSVPFIIPSFSPRRHSG